MYIIAGHGMILYVEFLHFVDVTNLEFIVPSFFCRFMPCPRNLWVKTVNQQLLVPVSQLLKNLKTLDDSSNLKMSTGKMMTNMQPENSREKYV